MQEETTVVDAWTVYLDARNDSRGDRHYTDHKALAKAGGIPAKRGTGGKGATMAGLLHPRMSKRLADLPPSVVEELALKQGRRDLPVTGRGSSFRTMLETPSCTSMQAGHSVASCCRANWEPKARPLHPKVRVLIVEGAGLRTTTRAVAVCLCKTFRLAARLALRRTYQWIAPNKIGCTKGRDRYCSTTH